MTNFFIELLSGLEFLFVLIVFSDEGYTSGTFSSTKTAARGVAPRKG